MALSTRVVILLWLASGLMLVGILFTVHQLMISDYELQMAERERSEITRLASDLDQTLQRRLFALDSLAWRLGEDEGLKPETEIQNVIEQPTIAYDLFPDGLLVFDERGTAIAENRYVPDRLGTNYADRPHFQRAFETGAPVITDPILGRTTNAPLISFLVPVLDDTGKIQGLVGGIVDLSETPILPERDHRSADEDVISFIVDPKNRLFVSTDEPMDAPESLPESGENSLVDAALESFATGSVVGFEGQDYVIASSQVEHLGWVVLRAFPYDTLIQPARETFARLVAIGALIAVLVGVGGWAAARTLTQPLGEMTRRIELMAEDAGEFDELPVKGSPEVSALARAMNRLARERQALDRLKDDFVSSVSHELRTPLTSLYGGLRLVDTGATGEIPERARSVVALALRNSQRLLDLINDLLDFNRLVAGRVQINKKDCSLQEVVTEAVADIEPTANAHGIQFETTFPHDSTVFADPQRLRQVIDNLLSNAVKYSPADGRIKVSVNDQGQKGLQTIVSDQGEGVPEAFTHRIFQRFAQAEHGTTRSATGTGLGLAISRELVVRMDGDIGYYNEGGAHFWFLLPKRACEQ